MVFMPAARSSVQVPGASSAGTCALFGNGIHSNQCSPQQRATHRSCRPGKSTSRSVQVSPPRHPPGTAAAAAGGRGERGKGATIGTKRPCTAAGGRSGQAKDSSSCAGQPQQKEVQLAPVFASPQGDSATPALCATAIPHPAQARLAAAKQLADISTKEVEAQQVGAQVHGAHMAARQEGTAKARAPQHQPSSVRQMLDEGRAKEGQVIFPGAARSRTTAPQAYRQ